MSNSNFSNLSSNSNKIIKLFGNRNELVILLFFSLIIVLTTVSFLVYIHFTSKGSVAPQKYIEQTFLTYMHNGDNNYKRIPDNKIPSSVVGDNFALGFWIFVKKFSNKNEKKYILSRGNISPKDNILSGGSPTIFLEADTLNIHFDTIHMITYNDENDDPNPSPSPDSSSEAESNIYYDDEHKVSIGDISLGKWIHVFINSYNNICEVFINGKLDTTKKLFSKPKQGSSYPLHISPENGFNGIITRLTYYNANVSAQKIFEIYKQTPRV
tara:strand:- start:234 stop:1040 length:807 start_codon:yes stop_codon:yes gene_type:complete